MSTMTLTNGAFSILNKAALSPVPTTQMTHCQDGRTTLTYDRNDDAE
jgi:hypothetical protein